MGEVVLMDTGAILFLLRLLIDLLKAILALKKEWRLQKESPKP
jgi:hypothetical protein